MPIHVGVPWLSFWLLSGSRAPQGYMRSPITELWKFLGFKHCSLHSLSLSYLLLLSLSWTFFCVSPQLLLLSLNMNSLYTSTPTQPCAPNFCVQYILLRLTKVHLVSCTLFLYVAKNFDWSSSPIADLMMRTRSDPWDKIVIILWEPKKLPKR